MDSELKPALFSNSELEYSEGTIVATGLEDSRRLILEAASDLGLKLSDEEPGRLALRERLHGFSLPTRLEIVLRRKEASTSIWILGTCSRLALPAGDFSYLKWIVGWLVKEVESLARERTENAGVTSGAARARIGRRTRLRRIALAQRVGLLLVVPIVIAILFSPRWMDVVLLLAWTWVAAFFVLGAETVRRKTLGAEYLPYLVTTLAWAVLFLACSLWVVFFTSVLPS